MRFTVGNVERAFLATGGRHDETLRWRRDVQAYLDAAVPAAGGLQAARSSRRVVVAVNGLWEFSTLPAHRPLRLEMLSHFLLLVDLINEFARCGLQCDLIDFRHPGRSAAFFDPPAIIRMEACPPDPLGQLVANGYREALDKLLPEDITRPRIVVVEPEHIDQPIEDLTLCARAELIDSSHEPPALVLVCGGILSPYFLEHALGGVPTRSFLYCHSQANTTLRPAVYEAALSPVPQRTRIPGLKVLPRPGYAAPWRAGRIPLADDSVPLARVSAEEPCIVAIGISVGGQIDDAYIDLLGSVRRRVGRLTLCLVGRPGLIRPDLAQRLADGDVVVRELGLTTSIAATLAPLAGRAAVACNPRSPGNAGCLTQVVLAGIPVLIWAENDAERTLGAEVFVESEAEFHDRLVLLLTQPETRAAAVSLATRRLLERAAASRRELHDLVNGPPAPPP
jgi:hypothetical protein